jgi:O-antigen/teichoic acid export membrane protein
MSYATSRTALVVSLVGALAAWLLIPYAVRFIYGSDFDGSVWPLRWLLPGIVLLTVQRPLGAILLKRGRAWLYGLFGFGALAINVVANLILLPRVGIVGASIASSLCYAALAVANILATWDRGTSRLQDLVPGRADVGRLWAAWPKTR